VKKLFKTILAVLLSIALVFPLSGLAAAQDVPTTTEEGIVFVEDMLADPEFSGSIIEYLHDKYGEQFFINQDIATATANLIYDNFPARRSGMETTVMYPPSFGGMYIDSDGNLVVLSVEGMVASRAITSAYSVIAAAEGANVRSVEFSYAELRNTFMSISNFLSEYYAEENLLYRGCPIVYNIDSAGIDTRANRVEVALLDTSPGQLELFRENVVDHPALVFVQVAQRTTFGDPEEEFDRERIVIPDDYIVEILESANAWPDPPSDELGESVVLEVLLGEDFNEQAAYYPEDEANVLVLVNESAIQATSSLEEIVVFEELTAPEQIVAASSAPYLSISPTTPWNISAAAGSTRTVTVTTRNLERYGVNPPEWLTLAWLQGIGFTLTSRENPFTVAREVEVEVRAIDAGINPPTGRFMVRQAAATPSLTISPTGNWNIPVGGGSRDITVTSNLPQYQVISQEQWSWLTVQGLPLPRTGFRLTAGANPFAEERRDTIIVRGEGVQGDRRFNVTQAAPAPFLRLLRTEDWLFPSGGGLLTVGVETNLRGYSVHPPSWVTVSEAPTGDGFNLTARPNPGIQFRVGRVTVRGNGVADRWFYVIQAPARSLTISQTRDWNIPAVGGAQLSVAVHTNVVANRAHPSWLDFAQQRDSAGNIIFTLTARPNFGATRTGTVTVFGEDVPARSFNVTQTGAGTGGQALQVHPGGAIRHRTANGPTGSIGYRARWGDIDGFVTVAHGGISKNDRFFFDDTLIGTVINQSIETDSSFVQLADGVSMSNRNPYAAPTITVSASMLERPLQGHVVTRISEGGRGSTTIAAGEIVHDEDVLHIRYLGPVLVFGANLHSTYGDSGGIVVHWDNGMYQVAGIVVSGRHSDEGIEHSIMFFSPSVRINNALDIFLR